MIHLNKILFPAAIVCALTSGIHIFMGGAEIIPPFLDLNFDIALKLTLLAVWHMASAVLVLSTVTLFVLAFRKGLREKGLLLFIGISYLVFGAVFLIICFVYFNESLFLQLPQWILLLPIGVLTLWGGLRKA